MGIILYAVVLAQVGVGWLFIRYIIQQDRGTKEPAKALRAAGWFGVLAVIAAIYLEARFVPASVFNEPGSATVPEIARASTLVGIIEECAKSLPLALFLYRKQYFNEMTDGVIYFGIAGMVFGVIEDIGYALSMGPGVGLMRIIIAPYIHAAFCALFGWSLAMVKVRRAVPLVAVAGGLVAIVLHAVYDFGLVYGSQLSSLGSLALALALNYGVFLLLRYAQRIDGEMGLATLSNNLYCQACGHPNPERFLYCTQCGKRT